MPTPTPKKQQLTFDLLAAASHIAILTGEPDPVMNFRLVPESQAAWAKINALSAADRRAIRMNYEGTLSELADRLKRRNAAGYAVFVLPGEAAGERARKANMRAVRALVLDLDGTPLPAKWDVEPSLIVETSPGRYQCFWPIKRTNDFARFEDTARRLATHYGGDVKVCDCTHVFRLAGFAHQKGEPFTSRIVKAVKPGKVKRLSLDWDFAFLPKLPPREKKSTQASGGLDVEGASLILQTLDASGFAGEEKWLPLAMSLHDACGGDEEVCDLFLAWCREDPGYNDDVSEAINRQRWDSFNTGKESRITIGTLRKICREHDVPHDVMVKVFRRNDAQEDFADARDVFDDGIADEAPTAPKIDFPPFEWTPLEGLPQREYVFEPAYERGYVTLTVAAGGAGKSALVRVECLEMASGVALLGSNAPPKPARVGYWDGEDDIDEDRRAFGAIVTHYGLNGPEVYKNLHVVSGRDIPIKIATTKRGDFHLATPVVDGVIAAIKRRELDVLIVDPFVSSHSANENDNVAMDAVVKTWARIGYETGCSIQLVHHTRKVNGELASIESARGASAMNYAARVRRAINRMAVKQAKANGLDDKERRRHFSLDYESSSHIPAGEALKWYRFESVTLPNGRNGGDGTRMGVVVAANVKAIADVDEYDVAESLKGIRGREWRKGYKAGKEWIGVPIAKALGLETDTPEHRTQINTLVREWFGKGLLEERPGRYANGTPCMVIVAAEPEYDFG